MLVPKSSRAAVAAGLFAAVGAQAQNSALSSHLNYTTLSGSGNILINEVRVPAPTTASTYYETLGWGGTGSGYGGIQQSGVRNFIFSIWDNAAHTAPIRTVFRGHGTTTEGFGGEGTGLKSMNTRLNWQTDVWYTLASRCWPVGSHTYYGYWYRDGVSGKWRHLVTMDVAAANSAFSGGNTSFLEDWSSTGQNRRETNLRGGWKRSTGGTWQAATTARYSINGNDIGTGGRSYNYRNNWDGGKKSDATGEYWYMVAGGSATKPTTTQPANFSIPRAETRPAYPAASVLSLEGTPAGGRLILSWKTDSLTLPQFGHVIEVFDNPSFGGAALLRQAKGEPEQTSDTVGLAGIGEPGRTYYGRFAVVDLLDNTSAYRAFVLKDGAITVSAAIRGIGPAPRGVRRGGIALLPGASAAGLPDFLTKKGLKGADGRSRSPAAAGIYLLPR